MSSFPPTPRRSPVTLAALIGFIVLFSAVMSGWAYFESGLEKWGSPAWTGDQFPGSRFLLIAVAALAAFMNFLFLSEGISSTNPPMVFMWLAILWLAATLPAAALFYAIDLRTLRVGRPTEAVTALDVSLPQWAFFVIVLVVVVAGALAMYGDGLGQFVVLTLVSLGLAYGLDSLNTRLLDRRRHVVAASPLLVTGPLGANRDRRS